MPSAQAPDGGHPGESTLLLSRKQRSDAKIRRRMTMRHGRSAWMGAAVVALAMLGSQSSLAAGDHDRDRGRDRSLKASLSGFEEPPAILTTGRGELDVKISRDEESFEVRIELSEPRGDGDAVPYPRRPVQCQWRDRRLALPDGDECRAGAKRGWPGPDLPGWPGRGNRVGNGDRSPGHWPRGTRRGASRIRGITPRDASGRDVCQRPLLAAKPHGEMRGQIQVRHHDWWDNDDH